MTQLPEPRLDPQYPERDAHIPCLLRAFDGSFGDTEDLKPTADARLLVMDPHVTHDRRRVQITELGRRYWEERAPAKMKARVALIERFGARKVRDDDDTVGLLALSDRLPGYHLEALRTIADGADALGIDWRRAAGTPAAPGRLIALDPHGDAVKTSITGVPGAWGAGASPHEAVGALISAHAELLGLRIESRLPSLA